MLHLSLSRQRFCRSAVLCVILAWVLGKSRRARIAVDASRLLQNQGNHAHAFRLLGLPVPSAIVGLKYGSWSSMHLQLGRMKYQSGPCVRHSIFLRWPWECSNHVERQGLSQPCSAAGR